MMNPDKAFYGTWGSAILMLGVCAIIGMALEIGAAGILMIWVLCLGAILLVLGIMTMKDKAGSAQLQVGAGMALVALSVTALAVFLELISMLMALALIVVFVGIGILSLGMTKK